MTTTSLWLDCDVDLNFLICYCQQLSYLNWTQPNLKLLFQADQCLHLAWITLRSYYCITMIGPEFCCYYYYYQCCQLEISKRYCCCCCCWRVIYYLNIFDLVRSSVYLCLCFVFYSNLYSCWNYLSLTQHYLTKRLPFDHSIVDCFRLKTLRRQWTQL